MIDFTSISPLDWKGLLVAIICGLIIGAERHWSAKPAGIRTCILICLSACIFVTLGQEYFPGQGTVRIIGQIVTGVGFLGAGVIIAKEGLVHGVTTAAVIWVLAAIGCLAGLGKYFPALLIAILTVGILTGMTFVEKLFWKLKKGVHRDDDIDGG